MNDRDGRTDQLLELICHRFDVAILALVRGATLSDESITCCVCACVCALSIIFGALSHPATKYKTRPLVCTATLWRAAAADHLLSSRNYSSRHEITQPVAQTKLAIVTIAYSCMHVHHVCDEVRNETLTTWLSVAAT